MTYQNNLAIWALRAQMARYGKKFVQQVLQLVLTLPSERLHGTCDDKQVYRIQK